MSWVVDPSLQSPSDPPAPPSSPIVAGSDVAGRRADDVAVVLVGGQSRVIAMSRERALLAGYTVLDPDPALLAAAGVIPDGAGAPGPDFDVDDLPVPHAEPAAWGVYIEPVRDPVRDPVGDPVAVDPVPVAPAAVGAVVVGPGVVGGPFDADIGREPSAAEADVGVAPSDGAPVAVVAEDRDVPGRAVEHVPDPIDRSGDRLVVDTRSRAQTGLPGQVAAAPIDVPAVETVFEWPPIPAIPEPVGQAVTVGELGRTDEPALLVRRPGPADPERTAPVEPARVVARDEGPVSGRDDTIADPPSGARSGAPVADRAPRPERSGATRSEPAPAPTPAPAPWPVPPDDPVETPVEAAGEPEVGQVGQAPGGQADAIEAAPTIAARGLRWTAAGEQVEVLAGVDLTVTAGEFVAILGAPGSGKSTLLELLAGIRPVQDGAVAVEGIEHAVGGADEQARRRSELMGFILQTSTLAPDLTALQNVQLPLIVSGWSDTDARAEAAGVLSELGVAERVWTQRPRHLSAGERQSVMVARAVAGDPMIVWADEPTTSLHGAAGERVLAVLRRLSARGATVVLTSTDPMVTRHADRVLVLERGRLHG